MKVYYKQPAKEIRIVKPDDEVEQYEFWVLTPVLVGSASKAGTQRVQCDGLQFTNLSSAAQHCLIQSGEKELASGQRHYINTKRTKFPLSGLDLATNNVWGKFAAARGLDPKDVEAVKRTYVLDREEMVILGLTQPGE